jgi:hypothetical protein
MRVRLNAGEKGFVASKKERENLRLEIHADVLNGCNANCAGCYIPRKTPPSSLKTLRLILQAHPYKPDEIVFGQTDIFDATNFYELLEDPNLPELYQMAGISYTSALKQPIEQIRDKLSMLWGVTKNPDIDFKIVLDIDDYLDGKVDDKKLALFSRGSVQFRVNYYKGIFDRISYNELASRVRDDYNSPITIAPNFFNNNNHSNKVERIFKDFRADMEAQNISDEFLGLYNMFNSRFNSYGCSLFSFYNNKFYIAPFLFDALPQRSEEFEVNNIELNSQDGIVRNLELTKETECEQCVWSMTCSSRNIPLYMSSRNIKTCVNIKKYMYADY